MICTFPTALVRDQSAQYLCTIVTLIQTLNDRKWMALARGSVFAEVPPQEYRKSIATAKGVPAAFSYFCRRPLQLL